jgi:hypothetical protein
MNRTWIRLRGALLALSFAGAMGFGATRALAAPGAAPLAGCAPDGVQVRDCTAACRAKGYDEGYCSGGYCICRVWV